MNLFLVIIALLLIVCIDHEVRINRLENDNDIIEGSGSTDLLKVFILLSVPLAVVCWMLWRDFRHEGAAEPATEWTESIPSDWRDAT
jgi:hypothetical protein